MARVACPNCGTPCVGCAGARLATASDGTPCCTKCLMQVEAKIKSKNNGQIKK